MQQKCRVERAKPCYCDDSEAASVKERGTDEGETYSSVSQQVNVTTLWRAAAMMMGELANSADLTQHDLFIVLVSALAMQLIV